MILSCQFVRGMLAFPRGWRGQEERNLGQLNREFHQDYLVFLQFPHCRDDSFDQKVLPPNDLQHRQQKGIPR